MSGAWRVSGKGGRRITIAAMTRTVLLALDTSTEFCSVALLSTASATSAAAGALASEEPRVWVRHEATGAVSSTRLLPAIRELFDEAGLALADCDAIAFGAGPGSFTGLRTATGVAQGLAFGLNCPVVPIGTLLACAESARLRDPSVRRVVAALDARMDEVYWADFAWDEAEGEPLRHTRCRPQTSE
jgi:tRNA threonylcarbamoyladenosine biosynthesis protein TsaB